MADGPFPASADLLHRLHPVILSAAKNLNPDNVSQRKTSAPPNPPHHL
jgi:hypothetical protein